LRDNIAALAATDAQLWEGDARLYLASAGVDPFDIVFLDPPYAADMLDELCRLLVEHGTLAQGARIYLELEKQQAPPELPPGWRVMKNKTAGNVRYMLVQ
jgi:16S rRNA (guanine966-N2)-methyltransferase